ncbi:MAG: hypothetical protein V3S30_01375 [Thermoanaerobaculia bacterium]
MAPLAGQIDCGLDLLRVRPGEAAAPRERCDHAEFKGDLKPTD